MKRIHFTEMPEAALAAGDMGNAHALRIDPSRHLTLRFRLSIPSPDDVEALRYARRAMIREERTRGLEWDEPSIEHPTFSATEIRWFVLASQVARSREKIAELVDRANRAREAMRKLRT
jgi:hypothetical protein